MIATREGIMEKCVVVKEITNERYFLRKEGKYLTIYKKTKNSTEVLIEILLVNNLNITPEKFWGLVEKETKGEKVYISIEELKKLDVVEPLSNSEEKTNRKIIDLEHNLKLRNA